jgi:LysM repeat protein
MKNPINKLRRLFVRTKTYNAAAAARTAPQASHDEDDGSNRLSGAFIVVLLLHIIAVVGVFAFARIKESRSHNAPPENPAPTAAAKIAPAKPAVAKAPAPAAAAPAVAASTPQAAPRESLKAPASGTHTTYIVKENDTLMKIAFAYNVGVPDLVSTNKLKNPADIHPGQPLVIPTAKPSPKSPAVGEVKPAQATAQKPTQTPGERKPVKTYVVQKGDTAVKIARDHGCSYEDLIKANNVKDPKKIQPGQVLKVPVKNS